MGCNAQDIPDVYASRVSYVEITGNGEFAWIADQVASPSEMVFCPILWGINLSHIYAREVR